MRAPRPIHQHRFDLAADALLIASGLFALPTAFLLVVAWITGVFEAGSAADAVVSDAWWIALLTLAVTVGSVVAGALLAWQQHGHAVRPRHAVALLAAPAASLVLSLLAPLLASLLQPVLGLFTDNEFRGPLGAAAVVGAVYLLLLLHAARDAAAPAGDPPALERLRLLSLTGLGVLALVVVGALVVGLDPEILEVLVFTMGVGFSALAITAVAALLDR